MATFLKLTNAAEDHDGKKIMINIDHIFSIMVDEDQAPVGSILYSGIGPQAWNVRENFEEIMEMMK